MKKILFIIIAMAFIMSARAQKNDTVKNHLTDTTVVDNPDVKPEFPGGNIKLFEFLAKKIRYPKRSRDKNIQGVVKLRVIIEKNGKVSNIQVMQSVNDELDNEAKRIMRTVPKFIPGLVNNKPVRTYYSLPISFSIQIVDDY